MNDTWKTISCYIAARMREASTWTQLVVVLTAFGAHFTEDQKTAVLTIGLALAGLLGTIFPDRLGSQQGRATDQPQESKPDDKP